MLARWSATRILSLVLAIAVAIAIAVAGASAAASADAPTPDEVCALLTAADATALAGKPVVAKPGSASHGGATCTWSDAANDGLQVVIETDALHRASSSSKKPPTAARRFKEMRDLVAKGQARVVAGVGDKAVWSPAFRRLWVLKKKKLAVIAVIKQSSPTDDLPGAKAVATKILPKL